MLDFFIGFSILFVVFCATLVVSYFIIKSFNYYISSREANDRLKRDMLKKQAEDQWMKTILDRPTYKYDTYKKETKEIIEDSKPKQPKKTMSEAKWPDKKSPDISRDAQAAQNTSEQGTDIPVVKIPIQPYPEDKK